MARGLSRAALLGLAIAALLAGARPARAHHSTAMFEWGKGVTITGTVEEFEWTNPHSWIWFNVADANGHVERWGLEGMTPSHLARHGWTKRTLKPGDKLTMVIYPLKDGRNGGFCVSVTFADGTTLHQLPGAGR